uniref:DM13 domain-containing protein n=1 Tax=Romanomermis culicivorax TaxID=13658 RepID=A0A915LBU8_ROMCU
QCPLKEEFQQQTLVINLPKNLTIHDVQWLSVMSPGADVDFGHTAIKLSKNQGIQPHLPPISEQDAILEAQGWPATKLIAVPQGKETEIKFTLGPAAGTKAKSLRGSCDSLEKVWYAEGLMQPEIWLQRGTRYVFQIFGGKSNPFYMTTDKEGGFATKNTTEKKNIINILGDKGQAVGQLCEHAMVNDQTDPDSFADFSDFSPNLVLNCPSKKRSFEIKWGADTTDLNDFYYGSYKAKFMGGKVRLCDRIDDSDENDPKCLRFKKSKKIVKTVL